MKILIADNYPLSRFGLVNLFHPYFPDYKIREADNEESIFNCINKEKLKLIILAISHPGSNAIGLLQKIKSLHKETPVLIICIYPESLYGLRALKLGASGYLSRESPVSEMVVAVKKILSGGIYISPSLAENLAGKLSKDINKPSHELLSDRELQILQLIASGKTAKKISSELFLSVNTISTYRARILSKLNLKTNAELARFAIENAII
jgi:DNA-binding NarL/FixJ family response regulator